MKRYYDLLFLLLYVLYYVNIIVNLICNVICKFKFSFLILKYGFFEVEEEMVVYKFYLLNYNKGDV